MTRPPTIPPEVIDCIAEGREPRIDELHRVADHICYELQGARSRRGMRPDQRPTARMFALRAAQAALLGT